MSELKRSCSIVQPVVAGKMHERGTKTGLLRAFSGDRRGAIAILFGLTAFIMFGLVGAAVDYSRWLSAYNHTMQAMDAAVLAAGRALQIGGTSEADALAVARKYYSENKSKHLTTDNTVFTIENGAVIVGVSNSSVATPLLNVVGIENVPVQGSSRAILAAGGNSGSHVEISLMLDTTGSMSGDKIDDLKLAAKDLIEIVVWDDQSEFTSRVALAPFASRVNVSRDFFRRVTNKNPKGRGDQRTCVEERSGANRYTDEEPSRSNGYFRRYKDRYTCLPTSTIVPLTKSKSDLNTAIDNLPASGGTAGHLGTAWAWYLISPKWDDVWPDDATPLPYSMMSQLNEQGKPLLQKVAVIMTDGEYNTKFSGDSSATQAREICKKMKQAGVEVYTVGFEITSGGEADTTMAQCATSPTHYYNASNGEELRTAFRDIALKVSTLRLME